jgi:hypothetical protein
MFGEQSITDGVHEIKLLHIIGKMQKSPVQSKILGVKIDFDKNKIYYFNEDKFQGCISCTTKILEEGTQYR